MGLFGEPNIEKLERRKNVNGLIKALSHKKGYIRNASAEALGRIGNPLAVEPLITALNDKQPFVKLTIINALGKIGDPRAVGSLINTRLNMFNNQDLHMAAEKTLVKIGIPAVEPLISTLRKGSAVARGVAAEALGKIGDERAVEPLITALRDSDKDVRIAAVASLGKLNWQPDKGKDGAAYWIAQEKWECCVDIGAPAVELLIGDLKKQSPIFRRGTIEALTIIGAPAIEPLIAALQDKNCDVKENAVEALGRIGDARAVEPLIVALRDRDVRVTAMVALVKIGDARTVEPLIAAFSVEKRSVRNDIIRVLTKIGAPALPLLIAFLRDEFWDVREAAAKSLDQLGWQPDEGTDGAAYWIARREWGRAVQIGAPAVEPLIAFYLKGDLLNHDAIFALERISDTRAVAPLVEAMRHENPFVRITSAKLLVKLYKADLLDIHQKQTILTLRSTILESISTHYDVHEDFPCSHSDHEDSPADIVEFPL